MREYCKVLLLMLCFFAYCSVFAAAGDELRCIEKEREALLEFKTGLTDNSGILSSWGSEESKRECCQWQGINCSHHSGHVISLQLSTCVQVWFIRLRGQKISSALVELNYLTHLDLSCVYFNNVEIPDFIGSMVKLQYLKLRNSIFSGVVRHQLANLTDLRTLDLGENDLMFDNLHWLSQLSSLSLLDLTRNHLKDANSLQYILNLPSLKELYLSGCRFPKYFSVNFSSASLSVLDLSFTGLTSSSFHWLFNISSSLRSIDLSRNDFKSNIPSGFSKFAFLEHLDLSGCQLTGGIPKSFGNLSVLQTLDLSGNQLAGGIPKSFGNLSHLQTLRLSDSCLSESLSELFYNLSVGAKSSLEILELQRNNLYGSVPDVTLIPSLRNLQIQNNQLNGSFPHSFAHISKLEVLDLSSNQIRGSVPDLSAFVSLRELHLGRNKLTSLPTSLEQLFKIDVLDLSSNQIGGSIPDLSAFVSLRELHLGRNKLKLLPDSSLGQLSMLEILDLSFNSLGGAISEIHLSKLYNLKRLDLSFNSLVFDVSADWNPPFQLDVIKLASCNVGPHFPTWLRTQTYLHTLDLSFNDITDEVPKWMWDFSPKIDYLNLSHNHIIGSIPDLSSMKFGILDISSNNLSGLLPSSLFRSFNGVLFLSDNMFVGSISSICTTSQFATLELSYNQFSGELPDCWENFTTLGILNLSNNKFSGNIPHSLGSLRNLKMLRLGNNNFSGELPSTLMNLSRYQMFGFDSPLLQMLDVGGNNLKGNIPAWIGTHHPNLNILSLGRNNFSGHIPTEICYLSRIQILDLSSNFLLGKIPQCFNNFTSLIQKNITFDSNIFGVGGTGYFSIDMYIDRVSVQWKRQQAEYGKTTVGLVKLIDLSSNRLVGSIPNEFSQLRALISLNLSRNYFSGYIIPNIAQMEMLEILDLSRNNFSGEIPKGMAKLDRLAVLDLSNNHLSGRIPSSTQLQSFEPSAYAPNDGLCGPPLMKCPGDHESNPPTTQHGKQEINVDHGFMAQLLSHEFYVPIIMGFIVGFWGIIATLVLKNSWRYAYFNFFSKMGDWLYMTTMVYARRLKRSLKNNVPN